MKLEQFKTDTFAGINNRQLSFQPGLNVILGPNEAGKSTLVEAIFATIFQDARLRMNLGADKEFKRRFMPYPDGDYINGSLEFENSGEKYSLHKEWGDSHSVALEMPDGQLIKNNQQIKQCLKKLFGFGKATYGNVVFARQDEVKEVIEKIISNDNITNTISTFLRKAVMELEGISVEKLRTELNEQLNKLTKRWDLENGRPDNPNRDIHNPYKVGYGDIYQAYLNKAATRQAMEESRQLEDEFNHLSDEIKKLKAERESLNTELTELEKLEDDIFKRARLDPEIKRLQEKSTDLKKINQQWPLKEDKIKRKRAELEELDEEIADIKDEKAKAGQRAELQRIQKLLTKVKDLQDRVKEREQEKSSITEITAEQLNNLVKLESDLKRKEAFLEASTLLVRIRQASSPLQISRGVSDPESISAGEEFQAKGYLRLQLAEELDVEVQSAEINFTELKQEYQQQQQELQELLDSLKVENIAAARLNREKYTQLTNELKYLQQEEDNALGGHDFQQLEERVAELAEIEAVREITVIEAELEELQEERAELIAEGRSLRDQLANWQEQYGEPDNLLDLLIEIRAELKTYQKELLGLAELPAAFASVAEFKQNLSSLRMKRQELDKQFHYKREQLAEITAELPDESYEELEVQLKEYQREYQRLVKRAIDLLKIQQVVENKLQELDDDTFTPLAESFSNYLELLTAGRYQLGELADDFHLEIVDQQNKILPVDISFLSYGTYDGVALAFRFALLEQLFSEQPGFIILDDCLVNLDPGRKEEAITLINKFADSFQVIFTTCDPETARQLGGNIIEFA